MALVLISCAAGLGFLAVKFLLKPTSPVQENPSPGQTAGDEFTGELTEERLKKEALDVMNRLVEEFPDSADPVGLLGNLYLSLGNASEAIKCWEKCIELAPDRPESYRSIAEIALKRGEYDRAAKLLRKTIELAPRTRGLHGQLGRALIDLGRPAEAISELQEDIKISPSASVSHFLMAQAHQQLGEYEKARASYLLAFQLDPRYTEACYGLTVVCARLGLKDKAAEYREKFKELKARDWKELPDLRDAVDQREFMASLSRGVARTHTNAGLIYSDHGFVTRSLEHWKRAAMLDPGATECRLELAAFYERNGNNKESLRLYDQLRRIDPKNPQYHLNTGVLRARMNRIEDALSAVQQAIELDPGNASYREIYLQILNRK